MVSIPTVIFSVGIIASFLIQTKGADQYTDGKRPYEFGFSIDGEQHRHEKKDEKGLIMGEFGFITADGVYHVTVYATDEQGRFKILSMKNIRVKPYPTYKQPAGSARQGHSLDVQTPQQALPQEVSPTQATIPPFKKITIEKPVRSCSSCSIPSPTTVAPAPIVQQNVQNTSIGSVAKDFGPTPSLNSQKPKINSFPYQQNTFTNQNIGSNTPSLPNIPNNYNNPESLGSFPNTPPGQQNFVPLEQELVAPNQDSPNNPAVKYPGAYSNEPVPPRANPQSLFSSLPQHSAVPNYVQNNDAPRNYPTGIESYPADSENQGYHPQSQAGRTPKKYEGQPQKSFGSPSVPPNGIPNSETSQEVPPNKPTLISAQMQIVVQNADIYKRGPGEREGLPDGLTKDDMTQLLYTFNYTVGFHGHFEEGYRNGAKQGYYYVTGRNGVRTRVDYVADENGFRPKITQEVLDLLSDDVPKPETEKDDKYGLEGYEFKWLYYPIESKGR